MRTTWVLESNVFSERCFDEMMTHLEERAYPHHVVRIIPFSHEVVGGTPNVEGPCVVYGTLGIQKLAVSLGWKPGVWTNDNFSPTTYAEQLGDLFLNQGLIKCRLTEVVATARVLSWPEFFIKPNSDGKAFAGSVVESGEIAAWVEQLTSSGLLSQNDFEVVMAAPLALGREWRTVMVGGKVVARWWHTASTKSTAKSGPNARSTRMP